MSKDVRPGPVVSYETAYVTAPLVLAGRVTSFDADQGVTILVTHAERGDVAAGRTLTIANSDSFPFLNEPDAEIVVFLAALDEDIGQLAHPPGGGGLIWQAPQLLEILRSAAREPAVALIARDPRTRLSGAWFVSRNGPVDTAARKRLIEASLWALVQPTPATAQAGVDTLMALDVGDDLLTRYHPGASNERKHALVAELRARLR